MFFFKNRFLMVSLISLCILPEAGEPGFFLCSDFFPELDSWLGWVDGETRILREPLCWTWQDGVRLPLTGVSQLPEKKPEGKKREEKNILVKYECWLWMQSQPPPSTPPNRPRFFLKVLCLKRTVSLIQKSPCQRAHNRK